MQDRKERRVKLTAADIENASAMQRLAIEAGRSGVSPILVGQVFESATDSSVVRRNRQLQSEPDVEEGTPYQSAFNVLAKNLPADDRRSNRNNNKQ